MVASNIAHQHTSPGCSALVLPGLVYRKNTETFVLIHKARKPGPVTIYSCISGKAQQTLAMFHLAAVPFFGAGISALLILEVAIVPHRITF